MQRGRRLAQPRTLLGEVTLEVIDVGLEEVAPGAQRVDLGLDVQALGFAGSPSLLARLVEQPCRHLPGRVDRLGGLGARFALDPLRFGFGLGDGGVGGALREQQGPADRFGLVDRRRRCRCSPALAGSLVATGAVAPLSEISCRRATAARARASIAVDWFCARSSSSATSVRNSRTSSGSRPRLTVRNSAVRTRCGLMSM